MKLKHALEIKYSSFYSNQQIANHTRLSPTTVSNILRGKTSMLHLRTFSRLAHYFQSQGLTICVGDFFRWEDEELVPNVGFLIVRLKPIPKHDNIAQETGIPFSRLKNLVRGNVKRVYLEDLAALLEFFRKRGLEIKLGDLLREEEAVKAPLTRRQHRKYLGEDQEAIDSDFSFSDSSSNEDSENEAFDTRGRLPIQLKMLPEVAEVVRMLTQFPEPLQKDTAAALKVQLEVIQKASGARS